MWYARIGEWELGIRTEYDEHISIVSLYILLEMEFLMEEDLQEDLE